MSIQQLHPHRITDAYTFLNDNKPEILAFVDDLEQEFFNLAKIFNVSIADVWKFCEPFFCQRFRIFQLELLGIFTLKMTDSLPIRRRCYNYYAVSHNNIRKVQAFIHKAKEVLFKWLDRRSQIKSFNWQ